MRGPFGVVGAAPVFTPGSADNKNFVTTASAALRVVGNAINPLPLIDFITNAMAAPGASDYRQRGLAAAGISSAEFDSYQVHHIVAQSPVLAGPAQIALAQAGIGIHDIENLVALRTTVHMALTNNGGYYGAVNAAVVGGYRASGAHGVYAALAEIKASLLIKGSFP
jgi:hypothetical protein